MMTLEECKTLAHLRERVVALHGDKTGYLYYDHQTEKWVEVSWREFDARVLRWRKALAKLGLQRGDRVSMLLVNSLDALTFDSAALANALVPVPLHSIDTPESSAYILSDSGARFLVTTARARWNAIAATQSNDLSAICQVVFTADDEEGETNGIPYQSAEKWLADAEDWDGELPAGPEEEDLAAIVYTSGTTGRPKGVMLTHANVLSNVVDINEIYCPETDDVCLSYLPLSHTFERSATYYNAMVNGATLAFSRGVMMLLEDFQDVRPTLMCTVPRVLEQFHAKLQAQFALKSESEQFVIRSVLAAGWRRFCQNNDVPVDDDGLPTMDPVYLDLYMKKIADPILQLFGGRMRDIVCGGAALNYSVGKFFSALGLRIRQGYGLTEYSPVISISGIENNHLETVGHPLRRCEVRAGDMDELQVRGPSMMKGYWNKPKETADTFTEDGWLKTGDQVDLSDGGRVRIKGRIKEIIVTSTGEKISPVDLEFAIQEDHLFEQVMAVGEGRPYITALAVVNEARFTELCQELDLDPKDPMTPLNRSLRARIVKRIRHAAKHFPQYGVPRNVYVMLEHWTPENGLLTTTMKMRRRQIQERYAAEIETLYEVVHKR